MKNIFKFEWNRMIHSKTFLISAIAASLMIIADVVAWFLLYLQGIDVDTSIFYKWLGVNRGMNAGVLVMTETPVIFLRLSREPAAKNILQPNFW